MAVTVKSEHEIQLMREAGEILAKVHEELHAALKPGMTTLEIDRLCEKLIRGYDCIPSKKRVLREGDIVSLDTGVIWKGWQSDAARTWAIGEISKEAQDLIDVTRASFFAGLRFAKAGNHLNDICGAIGDYAEERGYGVVRDLVGHGIGTEMHEDPEVPNFRMNRKGIRLQAGMTLAIEPMITIGTYEVDWGDDGWTVTTADGSLAAHYENTILITDGEPEILSLGKDDPDREQ